MGDRKSQPISVRIDQNRSGPCHCLIDVSHLFELQGNFYGKSMTVNQAAKELTLMPNSFRILKSNKTMKVIN